MNWWKILKNAKISGKTTGKGSSFDASKIKINIEEDRCKKELMRYYKKAKTLRKGQANYILWQYIDEQVHRKNWQEVPEEVACKVIKKMDAYFISKPEVINGLLAEPNFSELKRNMNTESVNIDGYVLEREVMGIHPQGYAKHIEITYRLVNKKITAGSTLCWLISSSLWEEAGDLSESELDWRK